MGCVGTKNQSWGNTLDSEVTFTGYTLTFAGVVITPNMDVRDAITLLAQGINNLQNGMYEPFFLKDNSIAFDLTFAQINNLHPEVPIGGVIYNSLQGFKYTRISLTEYEFNIIEVR